MPEPAGSVGDRAPVLPPGILIPSGLQLGGSLWDPTKVPVYSLVNSLQPPPSVPGRARQKGMRLDSGKGSPKATPKLEQPGGSPGAPPVSLFPPLSCRAAPSLPLRCRGRAADSSRCLRLQELVPSVRLLSVTRLLCTFSRAQRSLVGSGSCCPPLPRLVTPWPETRGGPGPMSAGRGGRGRPGETIR